MRATLQEPPAPEEQPAPSAPSLDDVSNVINETLSDPAAAMERFGPLIEGGLAFLGSAIVALIVLWIGLSIAGRVRRGVSYAVSKSPKFDETLGSFFGSVAYYTVTAIVVITVLGLFGIPTTSFAALIGAAGLAIGLSLQGTLGNLAAGVLLLAFRPFKLGEFVEAGGHSGTVKAITLFTTELATVDNKKIIIPNGAVFDGSIVNFSSYGERRLDLVFGIAYDADIDQAMGIIRSVVDADDAARATPEPTIEVDNLGDSSVDLICRVWCAGSDYFPLKWRLLKTIKQRFDAEGVGIPFPTRTIVMEKADA